MGIKLDETNKTYTVSYSKRDPFIKGKIHTLKRIGIKTEAQAKRTRDELILQIQEKIKKAVIPCWRKTVAEYLIDLSVRNVSRQTVSSYGLCLEAHTLVDWGDRLIDSITSQEIRELIQSKVGHRSPSHQKNVLKYIRAAFNFAVEKGYLNRNPAPQMKFKIGGKMKCVLTEPQVETLLTQAKLLESEWYPHWVMALYTGMRNGELYALTWDRVNLEERKILVNCSWSNKDGFKDTKSGDDRIAEIAPELLYVLKELKLKNQDSAFVLPRIDKWDKGEQARELRMFLQGLGLPRMRFHDLRATWATILLGKGIPPIKVMIMGGWKDLKTMQIYIRKAGVDLKGVTDGLSLHDPCKRENNLLSLQN